jgi:hypothetical protein
VDGNFAKTTKNLVCQPFFRLSGASNPVVQPNLPGLGADDAAGGPPKTCAVQPDFGFEVRIQSCFSTSHQVRLLWLA